MTELAGGTEASQALREVSCPSAMTAAKPRTHCDIIQCGGITVKHRTQSALQGR